MNKLEQHHFERREQLDQQLASDVASKLLSAIERKSSAILAVSGGSTPVNFFHQLAEQDIPWQKVTITLADERWVPPGHDDSNYRLVAENLLQGKAASATLIPLYNGAPSAELGEAQCEDLFSRLGHFDLVILGMGGDGHTASLFPQAEALTLGLALDSGRHALAVDPVTAPHPRMSLTLPRLLDASEIIIHITGDEKRSLLEQASTLDDPRQLPIAAVLQQSQTPVALYWAP